MLIVRVFKAIACLLEKSYQIKHHQLSNIGRRQTAMRAFVRSNPGQNFLPKKMDFSCIKRKQVLN